MISILIIILFEIITFLNYNTIIIFDQIFNKSFPFTFLVSFKIKIHFGKNLRIYNLTFIRYLEYIIAEQEMYVIFYKMYVIFYLMYVMFYFGINNLFY